MNVVSYDFGQVLRLFPLEEMRPTSGIYLPDLLNAIRDRYRFVIGPDVGRLIKPDEIKFESGVSIESGNRIAIKSLGMYPDGIVTACWKTDDANIVTDDLIDWLIVEFGMQRPKTISSTKFSSNVVVDFSVSIDALLGGLGRIARLFNQFMFLDHGINADIHLQKFTIGPDPDASGGQPQNAFMMERRAGTMASSNRYYSAAPLSTPSHLKFLIELEAIAVAMTE